DRSDIRDILERASARDTVSRTAVGSFSKQLLSPFGIRVMGYIRSIGNVTANLDGFAYEERYARRSEEHTSELQSLTNLVCRLLLEKKKNDWYHEHTQRATVYRAG